MKLEKKIISNSLVIVANSHNPSILNESFLLKTGIINNLDEIVTDNTIITPHFSQIVFLDKTNIQLDLNRLAIVSNFSSKPYTIGQKYIDSVKFINISAVGINFDVELSNLDLEKWFEKHENSSDIKCIEIKYKVNNCFITVKKSSDTILLLNFNFHYDIDAIEGNQDLLNNIVDEWKNNESVIESFISKLF